MFALMSEVSDMYNKRLLEYTDKQEMFDCKLYVTLLNPRRLHLSIFRINGQYNYESPESWYTEGDISEQFIGEVPQILPSLALLTLRIEWCCSTAEVIDFCLFCTPTLIHLEMNLEEIPDQWNGDDFW